MLSPKLMLVPALLFGILAAVWLTLGPSLAESSADECRTSPGPAGPTGGHWYYRLNHTEGRRCWFLSKGAKVRSVAPRQSDRRARRWTAQHAPAEAALSTPRATPAQVVPTPPTYAPMALGTSATPGGDDNSRFTDFVSWPSPPISRALETRETSAMSTYKKNRVAADRLEPSRSAPFAEVNRVEPIDLPSEAAFSPTVFTGALAIALMLSAAIVTLARRFNKRDRSRTAAGWLNAYQQLRADLTDTAGHRSEPTSRPNGSISKRPTPTDTDCVKAGLHQLVRDLRRAEMQAKPRHRLEQEDRYPPSRNGIGVHARAFGSSYSETQRH
jgi:hypothetical protein